MKIRVAVIGAGAGGVVSLRHLLARPETFEAVAYEQCDAIGGTWIYVAETGMDKYGLPIHSSMYKNLRTNLPKEMMAFPDFPFPDNLPSYVTHTDVRQYLEDYCKHFKLKPHIKFHTLVEQVEPIQDDGDKTRWKVVVRDVHCQGAAPETHFFDAVMICNGQYAIPLTPELPGMETFHGLQMHSHDYRNPEAFEDMTVVMLGASFSGVDIALDIAGHAKQVYLGHNRNRLKSTLPPSVTETHGIKQVKERSVVFLDGKEVEADAILYCTGYRYNFPFLSDKVGLRSADERLTPLYKHLIHTGYPSLCIIGVAKRVVPFPHFDVQVQFFLSTLDGAFHLPNKEEMDLDTDRDFQQRLHLGYPVRHAHLMAKRQFAYNEELAKLGNFKGIPKHVERLNNFVSNSRKYNLQTYKSMNILSELTSVIKGVNGDDI